MRSPAPPPSLLSDTPVSGSPAQRADLLFDEHAVGALGEPGLWTADAFAPTEVRALRAGAESLREAGALARAGVGRGAEHQLDDTIRGDFIAWLEPANAPPALRPLCDFFDGLRDAANQKAWLGLDAYSIQLAWYPGDGAGYVRHRDAFRGDDNRRMTAIVYLNPAWEPAHGGALRVFVPRGDDEVTLEIEPVGGRLVVFLSDQIEHEVRPSFAPRMAATAWFRGRTSIL